MGEIDAENMDLVSSICFIWHIIQEVKEPEHGVGIDAAYLISSSSLCRSGRLSLVVRLSPDDLLCSYLHIPLKAFFLFSAGVFFHLLRSFFSLCEQICAPWEQQREKD